MHRIYLDVESAKVCKCNQLVVIQVPNFLQGKQIYLEQIFDFIVRQTYTG